MKQLNNFFAILTNGEIRKIKLTQDIVPQIRKIFIENSTYLFQESFEQIEFNGSYSVQGKDEEVLYVNLNLPDNLVKATVNALGQADLDLSTDSIKSLVWFEDSTYYFQGFDRRKLLRNKNVLVYDKKTFGRLDQDAFIIDDVVTAMFKDGKFYFRSYANANKIFSLIDFFHEATNEVLAGFSEDPNVVIDRAWLLQNANTIIRKHITFIQNSRVLASANMGKIQKSAKRFKLVIDLEDGKIKFPNNVQECRDILYYLNEHFYVGLITGKKYRTNSRKPVDKLA